MFSPIVCHIALEVGVDPVKCMPARCGVAEHGVADLGAAARDEVDHARREGRPPRSILMM